MRHLPYSLMLLLVLLAGPAAAADKEHKKITQYTVTDVHHQEKQLDLTNPEHLKELQEKLTAGEIEHLAAKKEVNLLELRWDTALWTIVVFILLFVILKKVAWGPMLEGLKKREENIQAALVEAREARQEARKLKDELQAERDQAAQKVAEMLAEARRDAEYTRNEMLAKAKADIQADRDRVLREVATAKDQALLEILNQQAELAILASSRAIRKSLTSDDYRRLVDEALAELRQAARPNGKA